LKMTEMLANNRESVPKSPVAESEFASSLRVAQELANQGKTGEAESLLEQASERFPKAAGLRIAYAKLAERRQDWREALYRWDLVCRDFPFKPAGCVGRINALVRLERLAEADSAIAVALDQFPNEPSVLGAAARAAQRRGDWDKAIDWWRALRLRRPDATTTYDNEIRLLKRLNRFNEAEELVQERRASIPQTAESMCKFGWKAYREQRWEDAEKHFLDTRTRFPTVADGWIGAARAMQRRGNIAGADQLLREGIKHLPLEASIWAEYATLPVARQSARRNIRFTEIISRNFAEAIRRFEDLRRRFPGFEPGYLQSIECLRNARRADEADALACKAMSVFPDSLNVALSYVRTAEQQGNHAEAIRRSQIVHERFPDTPVVHSQLASLLSNAGKFDEAECILQSAMQLFPADPTVLSAHADLAGRRGDWMEALARWEDLARRFPNHTVANRHAFDIRMRLAETAIHPRDTENAEVARGITAETETRGEIGRDATRELLMQFESLGALAGGCEFGLLQRRFGAEPLGLLRWTEIGPDQLITALDTRFEGVGQPEYTRLLAPDTGEWSSIDTRIGMRMHTFVPIKEVSEDELLPRVLKRLQYLSKKLISDLEAGEKIFVYKITARNLDSEEIMDLHRAVRSYGMNVLLYVGYSDADHPEGTVEVVRPGLMIGYIDRFQVSRIGEFGSPVPGAWLKICAAAYALRDKAMAGQGT
jgi:tetratricopeptide (TPR) repeat protein